MKILPVGATMTHGVANSHCRNSANAPGNEGMKSIKDKGEASGERKTGMTEDEEAKTETDFGKE